nr:RHS domain-containing protein [Gemmatimonadota bacterium]
GRHLPNGIKEEFTRDVAGRLIHQSIPVRGGRILERDYEYNIADEVVHIRERLDASLTVVHDLTGRIREARRPVGGTELFSYDATGNLKSRRNGAASKAFQYAAGNRIADVVDELGRETRYLFDEDGNLVAKANGTPGHETVTKFVYDGKNQLTAVVDPQGKRVEFLYDPFGRRVAKETSTRRTEFWWDGDALLAEEQARPSTVTDCRIEYVMDGQSFEPLCSFDAQQTFFYHNDHLGTPRELTSGDGTVVWSASYDVFGVARMGRAEDASNPFRFRGQYFDEETGLHYNRYRYYDPELNRYLTQDPLGLIGGPNPYGYVNDPLTATDPLGLAGDDPLVDSLQQRTQDIRSGNPNLGPNDTVAAVHYDGPGGQAIQTQGVNGRHDTTVTPTHPGLQRTPTQTGLGAVTPTHAEGRALTRLGNEMHARGQAGGSATMYVDRAPCPTYCRPQLQKVACRLGVTLRVVWPGGERTFHPGACD